MTKRYHKPDGFFVETYPGLSMDFLVRFSIVDFIYGDLIQVANLE